MRGFLRRFFSDPKGNVAILFAIAVVPVIGAMGAAVDYSMASAQRVSMQAAVDATALALAKIMPATQTELDARGKEWFQANMGPTPLTNVTLTISGTTGKLNVEAHGIYQPELISVLGTSAFPVSAKAQVKWGNTRLRIALVLDVTGSMSSAGKMPALKTATKNLLNQLKAAAVVNGDVYVSIVPFSKDVAVATSNFNANWVDFTEWEAPPPYMATWLASSANRTTWAQTGPGSTCPFTNSSHGFRCASTPTTGSSTTTTIPSSGTFSGYICPGLDNGARVAAKVGIYYNGCYRSVTISTGSSASCGSASDCFCGGSGSSRVCRQHTWRPAGTPAATARSTWNGCMTDRNKDPVGTADYDTKNTAPSAPGTLFPAEQYSSCPTQVMGLSYDWTALTNKIDALVPAGNTNQAIGLAWGWQTLTSAPFTIPPADPSYTYKQAIVLLSDGLNTQDRWYTSAASIDARQALTCNNVKATGVIVYTVQVNTDGDPTSTVLKNCATDSNKFFMLTSGSQIVTTFQQIATELADMHLSQ